MPDADERPVMQDYKDRLTDRGQFPGHKAGQRRRSLSQVQADSVAAA